MKLALIVVFGVLLLLNGCTSVSKNNSDANKTTSETDANKDIWSLGCKSNTYGIYESTNPLANNESHTCQSLNQCKTDQDCKYLEIDSLPPRIGQCINNQCKAICGSGRIWEC